MIFPEQQELTVQPEPLPAGQFLLPVCMTSQELNDLLMAAWYGRYLVRKELDEGGEEFHSIKVIMPLLQAMAFVENPYLAACWVGEVMGLIRVVDCQIEQFNLITQEWQVIEDASFLPLDLTCALTGHALTLRPETNLPGLTLNALAIKTGQDYFRVNRSGSDRMFSVIEPGVVTMWRRASQNLNAVNLVAEWAAFDANAGHGHGLSVDFLASVIGGTGRKIGDIRAFWANATDATRSAQINFVLVNQNGTLQNILQMRSSANLPMMGFFGVNPIVRPNVVGTTVPVALSSLIANLTALGLITNGTDFLANAANLIRLENCTLDQFNPVSAAWETVGSVVPTTITPACDVLTLDDTDWTIRRVDGSTEAANAVLRLRTERGTQSEALPMMMTFEQEQANDDMDTLAIVDVRNMAEDSPRLAISLFNGTGQDDLLEVRNGPAGRRMGFYGALPVQQQLLIADESFEETVTRIALGLEQLGLFRIAPCFSTFGDWGVKFTGEALTDLATCGGTGGGVITNELECPSAGDNQASMETQWSASPALNIVHVYVRFTIDDVVPAEGVNWAIRANPGGSSTLLDGANINAVGSYERAWNGSVAAADISFTISDVDQDAGFYIQEVRIEGTGAIPPDWLNGDVCA